MEELIDTDHPVWKEFQTAKFHVNWAPMEPGDWFRYIKLFSVEQLETFTNAFPKITTIKNKVIDNIIKNFEASRAIDIFNNLIYVWGCDYSKTDECDCISVCMNHSNSNVNNTIELLKYFLEQGATLQEHHLKQAQYHGYYVVKFLIEFGIDINDMAPFICSHMKETNPSMIENLKMMLESGVDLLGHIQDISKKD
jgi:hypothetical protein